MDKVSILRPPLAGLVRTPQSTTFKEKHMLLQQEVYVLLCAYIGHGKNYQLHYSCNMHAPL